MPLFVFSIDERLFGIDPAHLFRVIDIDEISPVPLTPRYHLGILYHRGELFDIVDLGMLLHGKGTGTGSKRTKRAFLLKWNGKRLGIVPDSVIGLVWNEDGLNGQEIIEFKPEALWNQLIRTSDGP